MQALESVQAIYAAFARGDLPALLARLSEDVEWEHDAVQHGIPWLAARRGRAEVGEFFASLSQLDIRTFDVEALLAGAQRVAAVIRVELVVKATGQIVRDLEVHLWTFDEHGLVARFRHVVDTLQHWSASR